jgi:hypothetical protein
VYIAGVANQKKPKYDYSWHSNVSSEGTLSLDLHFPDKGVTKEQKETALAESLRQNRAEMLRMGYLPPDSRWMSSRDIAEEYGHTRQYWEKLINEGKIPYKETAAGRITTDLWVQGYLDNKEKVDEYVRNRNKIVSTILSQKSKMGKARCPKCGEEEFTYAVNTHSMNGICRAQCGFRVHTTV